MRAETVRAVERDALALALAGEPRAIEELRRRHLMPEHRPLQRAILAADAAGEVTADTVTRYADSDPAALGALADVLRRQPSVSPGTLARSLDVVESSQAHARQIADAGIELDAAQRAREAGDVPAARAAAERAIARMTQPTDPWPAFDALEKPAQPEPLPIDALTAWQSNMVRGVADSTGFSADMAVGFCLAATSAAVAGRVHVEPWAGWREPSNLYIAIVADPSEGKSVIFRPLVAPLLDLEANLAAEHGARVATERELRDVDKAKLKRAKDSLADCAPHERLLLEQEVAELAERLERPEPLLPRLLAGDVTPEVAAVLLSQHQERLAILTPEDTLFGHLSGRHTHAKAKPAIEVFLSAYSGEPVAVDRLSRGPLRLNAPALTIGAAMQPTVLEGGGAKLAEDRGLLARFLYVRPPSVLGHRDLSIDRAPIPESVRQRYADKLTLLARYSRALNEPQVLRLTTAARAAFKSWRARMEPRRAEHGDLAAIRGWAGKSEGNLLRLAGLLAVSEGAEEVSEEVIGRAAAMLDALVTHALAAIGLSIVDADRARALRLLGWLRRRVSPDASGVSPDAFTERDARKNFSQWTSEQASAACRILSDHGYIRPMKHVGPGRPAIRWEVHRRRVLGDFAGLNQEGSLTFSLSSSSPASRSTDHPAKPAKPGEAA